MKSTLVRQALGMACLLGLLAWLLSGCGLAPEATLADDLGRPIDLKGTPSRIISLAPSNTEILFALGLGDKVVGTDDYSDYPTEARAKPKVGAPFPRFNLEAILALDPDLALAFGYGYTQPDIASQLERRGIPVIVLGPRDMEGVLRDIELVGAVAGARPRARELASEMRRRANAIISKAQGAARPRVFFEFDATDPTKPWTAGPGSFTHALLEMAGAANLGASGPGPAFQMSTEEIINADPEVIILADAAYGVTVESVGKRPGWGGLTAVKRGAIYPIDADPISRPGPRIVDGLEALARLVHPELFP